MSPSGAVSTGRERYVTLPTPPRGVSDEPRHRLSPGRALTNLDGGAQAPKRRSRCGVRAQRPQEVDPTEVRPERLAEVELAVRALPEQEPGQPLLTGGADHQVGVGLTAGVQVLGDVLDVEHLGQLLDRGAPRRLLAAAASGRRRRSRAVRRSRPPR